MAILSPINCLEQNPNKSTRERIHMTHLLTCIQLKSPHPLPIRTHPPKEETNKRKGKRRNQVVAPELHRTENTQSSGKARQKRDEGNKSQEIINFSVRQSKIEIQSMKN